MRLCLLGFAMMSPLDGGLKDLRKADPEVLVAFWTLS
jgi:hypothetical protein